jgi:pimeloyl-ACP methyl ester carboxylesterase
VLDAHGQDAVWNAMAQLAEADGAPPTAPEVGAFLRERFFASSAAGLRAMGEQLLSEPDRVAELAAIGLPTLVVYGADDDAWSPAAQADMAARLGAARHVIAGAGHSPNVEAPERLVTVLADYWADIDSRAARHDGE